MTVPEAIERADPAFVQEAGRHYGGFVRAVLERRLERYPSADATLSRNPQTVAGIQ